MEAQRLTTPYQTTDYESSRKIIESRNIINEFFLDFCGLIETTKGTTTITKRVSRPKFTYEFSKEITTLMYVEVNRITARTTFSKQQIKNYVIKQCETLADHFAIHGIRNLISEQAWKKILELNQVHPDSLQEDPITKQITGQTKWQYEHGIIWKYDDPVNNDMLEIIKTKYNLHDERFGQDTILRNAFWSIRLFIHGGINRSEEALTLNHEKVIHKETMVSKEDGHYRSDEGFIARTKENLMKRFNIRR
jgi:hypothetical protein